MSLPAWARAHGEPLFAAQIKARPEEFVVHEVLGFDPSGDGEHDYLWIEKTGANTEWVARQLARHAEVPARDVGYAGLKDRHAVTRQWFSVPRWNVPDWGALDVDGVTLLETRRHEKKLRRGAHRQNRFSIVAHGDIPDAGSLDERLQCIAKSGVPNYFGEQRFGRDGSNLELADAWASGRRMPRHKRSIAISTARSFLFNRILDARVRDSSWNRILPGDTVNLDGTGSVFHLDEVDDETERRCAALDIHPAGLLCGDGAEPPATFDDCDAWLKALRKAHVKAAYRSLRLRVLDLHWSLDRGSLKLEFTLGRGAFATSVLREVLSTG